MLRRSLLKRFTPLKSVAPIARKPMKHSRPKRSTPLERRHLGRVAELGCLVCDRPATVHHVTSDGHQRLGKFHCLTVPLCPEHHMIQFGPKVSVEALGQAEFEKRFGVDLRAIAAQLWEETLRSERIAA